MKGKIRKVLPPLIVLFLAAGLALSAEAQLWAAEAETSMPATPVPAVLELVGGNEISLDPTRFPEFYAFSSDNPNCGNALKNELSGKPVWAVFSGRNQRHNQAPKADPGYQAIPGLTKENFKIPAQYKNTAKLLVTWTVRILGDKRDAWPVWPSLCHPWHGTSHQRFTGGDVKTQLYVKDSKKSWQATGAVASMTIPDGGTASISQPRDPTLTGSYVLGADFFGGTFPDSIDIQVRWYNETSLKITSPAKMRNMVITMVPITTQE